MDDDVLSESDDCACVGVSEGNSGIVVRLLQYGVVQHSWYWSVDVKFSHGIIFVQHRWEQNTCVGLSGSTSSQCILQYCLLSGLISHDIVLAPIV